MRAGCLIKVVVSKVFLSFCHASVLCFLRDSVISAHGGLCVLLSGGDSWLPPPTQTQRGCDDWSVTSLSPACPFYTMLSLHPSSLAWPAASVVAFSLFGSMLHMGLVSHGNLLGPIRSSRQLGFPSILPSILSGPAMSLSVPLQWLHAPASHN